ncbi:hypothetical protein [Flavobacterium limi]|nr:hypothetical protein [Flavobacterium limi]
MKNKTSGLALIEAASCCCGVRNKRYSGEQDRSSSENDNFCS